MEGGWAAVLDVPAADVPAALDALSRDGFVAAEYYPLGTPPGPGRTAPGWTRIRIGHPLTRFTGAENRQLERAVGRLRRASGLTVRQIGVDIWHAGGPPGDAAVREPRRPRPMQRTGAASPAERSPATGR
jgi:hypothetical protein